MSEVGSALAGDLLAFAPELILCGTIVFMLLARLVPVLNRRHLLPFALLTTAAGFWIALEQWQGSSTFDPRDGEPSRALFTGLLIFDDFAIFVRLVLLASLGLVLGLGLLTRIPDRADSADFGTLIIGATLGMLMMASANHLLMVFIAVEMASLPSYVLAGFLKGRRKGSEASLKYVIYGAAAAGVMLYGISLITARLGTGLLPDVMDGYARAFANGSTDFALVAGSVLLLIGLGFKIAAVPFHFWCPDVFEGAAAEVGAFLSVASKAAAIALTLRISILLADTLSDGLVVGLVVISALTASLGNLAALGQSNLKRMLAYSTIAHAGYMLMGVAALNFIGSRAVLFYLPAYLIMNLGAFAVVALIRNRIGSEEVGDYAGLIYRAPLLTVTLTLFLVSLLGMPPLAGFVAKFQLFAALWQSGEEWHWLYITLLGIAVGNTVLSTVYYLRVVRAMTLDDPPEETANVEPPALPASSGFLVLLTVALFWVGLAWEPLTDDAGVAARSLFTQVDADSP